MIKQKKKKCPCCDKQSFEWDRIEKKGRCSKCGYVNRKIEIR